jgi:DNA-binding NtrC family response regulator
MHKVAICPSVRYDKYCLFENSVSKFLVDQDQIQTISKIQLVYFDNLEELLNSKEDYSCVIVSKSEIKNIQQYETLTRVYESKVIIVSGSFHPTKIVKGVLFIHIYMLSFVIQDIFSNLLCKTRKDFVSLFDGHNFDYILFDCLLRDIFHTNKLNVILESLSTLKEQKYLFVDDDISDQRCRLNIPNMSIANSIDTAIQLAKSNKYDLAILDIYFEDDERQGYEIIRHMDPQTKVIMLSRFDDFEYSLKSWLSGADYFVSKDDFTAEYLFSVVEMIGLENAPVIISKSPKVKELIKRVRQYSSLYDDILITGESGTGKELVAKALYALGVSKMRYRSFEAYNCASIPETLFESEMFGHMKGSFTGANINKKGFLELADHGLLFLDEIGDMPIMQQAKLLRALQEKKFRPIGGNKEIDFDCRVVYATNRNLSDEISQGRFREDFYYRMLGSEIHLPALRERKEDIALLTAWFTFRFIKRNKIDTNEIEFQLSYDELLRLELYDFPGNIRELEKMVNQACIDALINKSYYLKFRIPQSSVTDKITTSNTAPIYTIEEIIKLLQDKVITSRGLTNQTKAQVIAYLNNNQYKTPDIAALLGISPQSLRNIKSKCK